MWHEERAYQTLDIFIQKVCFWVKMNLMTVLSNWKGTLIEVGVNTPSVARSSLVIYLGTYSGNQFGLSAVAHQICSPPLASQSIQAELTAVITLQQLCGLQVYPSHIVLPMTPRGWFWGKWGVTVPSNHFSPHLLREHSPSLVCSVSRKLSGLQE